MQADVQSQIARIMELLQAPFWRRWEFWLHLVGIGVGVAALVYAIRAFEEAKLAKQEAERAKDAATAAGKTVRVQTVAIELGEISQKLGRLQPDARFSEARDLLNEVSWRLRRAISPFAEDEALKSTIASVRQALDTAQNSLKNVRPASADSDAPGVVYNGIESDFALIGNLVADLLGLFEKQTFDSGVRHVKS
jgi:hypothetical protein